VNSSALACKGMLLGSRLLSFVVQHVADSIIQISYHPLPPGIFRDNLQQRVGDFARLLVAQLEL